MQLKIFKRCLLLLISSFILTTIKAQSFNQQEQLAQQTVIKLFDALSNSDTAGLRWHCTANVHFYEYGQIWTIDTMIQKLMQSKTIPGFKRSNSFEFVSTTINQKTAWVTYYLQSTFIRNGKEELVKWMETVILIKQKKQWKIDVLHSTRLLSENPKTKVK